MWTRVRLKVFFLALCIGLAGRLMAATYSESQSVGSGTLYYTVQVTSGTCYYTGTVPPKPVSFTVYEYELFSYTDANSNSWNLTGDGAYTTVNNPYGTPNNCPAPGARPSSQITLTGGWGFDINFTLCNYLTCPSSYASVPAGYVDPKYIVAAEVYAPPGTQSSVTYGSDGEVANTTSLASSFTSSTTFSETDSSGFSFTKGLHGGKLTSMTTNTATQESSQTVGSSASWTTDLKSSSSYTSYGGPITWTGWDTSGFNPHDSDYAWLWLDPALPFNSPSASNEISFGYSWDACDPVEGLDFYEAQNGSLENGGEGTAIFQGVVQNGTLVAPLARNWATTAGAQQNVADGAVPSDCDGQTFASSDTPALGSTDFTNILAADPLLNEGYQLDLTSASNYTETGDGRYTRSPAFIDPSTQTVITTATDFPFEQASCAGCNPPTETYYAELTQSSSVGSSTDYKYSQTFGVDHAFSGSVWIFNFGSSLSQSNTVTTDYQTKTDMATSFSTYGTFTIVGPPCNPGGNPCAQVYQGPTEFDVYQDNKFGTFMFWPVQ